ncbi:unnamed protein product [Ambrosiozyma monospora]|uniref:Unnamed protein product n=1 Tax=Ambrosiozyma monospora TaxID=43982 RepID=A0ACB5TTY3_AMBMO|nr:unnamed protein product [Ambrosiozyma monospora]
MDTLNELTNKLAHYTTPGAIDTLPPDEKELLEYFQGLYKNLNRGIRGRGKALAQIRSPLPMNHSPLQNQQQSPQQPQQQQQQQMMQMQTAGQIPNQQQQQQQQPPPQQQQQQQQNIPQQQQGQVIMPPPIQSVPPHAQQGPQGTGLPVQVQDLSQPLPGAPPGQLLPGIGNVITSSGGGNGMKPNDGVISGH